MGDNQLEVEDDTQPEEFFGTKPNLNKDLVIVPPKSDIKNLVMAFVALEQKMLGSIPIASPYGIDDVLAKEEC
jgi:hypothetical protein